jgi:hypothetical protein
MVASGEKGDPFYKFALDPIAEQLDANRLVIDIREERADQTEISDLMVQWEKLPEDFVRALRRAASNYHDKLCETQRAFSTKLWPQEVTTRTSLVSVASKAPNLPALAASRNAQWPRFKLFLSYSHKDARLYGVFQENLALLEADGLITTWFDGKILPSAEWDKEIRRELDDADIIVFLVSTPFLRSEYIRGVEMDRSLKRRAAGEAELVAVILEDCDWKGRDFTRYQVLPPGVKPVRSWPRHADAFNSVEQQLRLLIKDIAQRAVE